MIKYLEKIHGKLPIKNVYKKDKKTCALQETGWLTN